MNTRLPCTVRFGEPIHVEDFGDRADPRIYRVMTDAVMYQISQLSGQTYVDSYAGKTPEQPKVAPTSPAGTPKPSIPSGRPAPTRPTVDADRDRQPVASSPASSAAGRADS
jgi:1-acyl-sn-glycerol-3-phosphate acyltransferase